MAEQPATPTPRKRRQPKRGANPAQQRIHQQLDPDVTVVDESGFDFDQNSSTEDEETLLDLLGVTSPPKPSPKRGILNLSKDNMDIALNRKARPQRSTAKANGLTDSDVERAPRQRLDGSPAPNRKGGRVKSRPGPEEAEEKGVESEGALPKASQGKNRRGKKGSRVPVDDELAASLQAAEQNSLPAKPKVSGITATKPKGAVKQTQVAQAAVEGPSHSAFDTASLSQSLPSQGLVQKPSGKKGGKKSNGSGDESAVWEMPEVAGGQELTWQQKLQAPGPAADSSRRNNRSNVTEKKPKLKSSVSQPQAQLQSQGQPQTQSQGQGQLLAGASPLSRPAHNRRASLDAIPTSSALGTRSISAFDSHIPFHTGYNVHRAPQTPAKGVAAANGNISNGILPIVSGDFPRIPGAVASQGERRGSNVPALGPKYAGPTFHNSPAAATLSKPDLEDF